MRRRRWRLTFEAEPDPLQFEEDEPEAQTVHEGNQEDDTHISLDGYALGSFCGGAGFVRPRCYLREGLSFELRDLLVDVPLLLSGEVTNGDDIGGLESPADRLNPRHDGQEASAQPIKLTASASGCSRAMAMRPGRPSTNTRIVKPATIKARMLASAR